MQSFQNRMRAGVFWSAVEVVIRQGSQLIVTIIMARLLAPEDFGVIALLLFFVGLAGVFIDGGFGAALIQNQNTSRLDESTVFYFNLGMGILVAIVLCLLAPAIGKYFEKPVLVPLTYAMAGNVAISTLGAIHRTLLIKELNFRLIARVGAFSSLSSGAVAIALAFSGFGVWSLAIQIVVASSISTLLFWTLHSWRPLWAFSLGSLWMFFRFGGYLFVAGIADVLHTNLYALLIGRSFPIQQVGFYDRAQKTQLFPVNIIMSIINRVAFSGFSEIAGDSIRLSMSLRKSMRLIMYINIPLSVSLIVLAEPIVLVLYGEKWLPSVPILQVLGVVSLIFPINVLNINALKASGRSDLFFRTMLIRKTVAIGLTIAGSLYGIMAIAWAQAVAALFSMLVNAHYSRKFLDYGIQRQLVDLFPSLIAAGIMGVSMWLAIGALNQSYYLELICVASLGVVVYLLISWLFRIETLWEIFALMAGRVKYP